MVGMAIRRACLKRLAVSTAQSRLTVDRSEAVKAFQRGFEAKHVRHR
jgi:hypothetical protein